MIYIDAACVTCHGTGKIMGGDEYHDCPSCRLRSQYVTRWCDSCHEERPVEGMRESVGEYRNRYTTCGRCAEAIEVAHEDSIEAAYKQAGYGALSPLEARYADGDR